MTRDSQSEQERLMRLISEQSMGAPFIFAPDQYAKGNASREPSDMAWVCNNCVLLMYLKKTNRSAEETTLRNLRQAAGWLRAWKAGQPLRGKNSYKEFDIPFIAKRHIVILSITDCPDAIARCHQDKVLEMGVTLCATLPLSVVHELVQMHASMIDLLAFINILRSNNLKLSEVEAVDFAKVYYTESRKTANAEPPWPYEEWKSSFSKASFLIHTLRRAPTTEHTTTTYANEEVASIFNDLALVHYIKMAFTLTTCIEVVRRKISNVYTEILETEHYRIKIGAVSDLSYAPPPTDFKESSRGFSSDNVRLLMELLYPLDYETPIIAYKLGVESSRTETLLNNCIMHDSSLYSQPPLTMKDLR